MYTNLYVYTAYRQYMSGKLYWRIKKDRKWTWKPAELLGKHGRHPIVKLLEEEECHCGMYTKTECPMRDKCAEEEEE